MKKIPQFFIFLIFALCSACNGQKNMKKELICYVANGDSIYYFQGEVVKNSTPKIKGLITDNAFLQKICNELKNDNTQKKDTVIIKPISTGANYSQFMILVDELRKNSLPYKIYIKLTNGEKDYFHLTDEDLVFFKKSEEINIVFPTVITSNDSNKKHFMTEIIGDSLSISVNDSIHQKIKITNNKNLNSEIKKCVALIKNTEKDYIFFIKGKQSTPYKLVDLIMQALNKNGIDNFKMITTEK
jgi:biopolymer transport protein ExbD